MQIWKEYNKRTKRYEWRARFNLNKKVFRPKDGTKEKLIDLIAEIRRQEKIQIDNQKFNLDRPAVTMVPTLEDVFGKILPTIPKGKQEQLCKRVFQNFLELLPVGVKINELSKTHFQKFIDWRSGQLGYQSKRPIKLETVYKELYAISGALKKGHLYFDSLQTWEPPPLPDPPKGFKKKNKRERLVSFEELESVVAELMKEPNAKQTRTRFHRVRLAHLIEFGYWTGLRRKEISRLKFSQYDETKVALSEVRRWKTDTVTKFFPLAVRADEIIKERRDLQQNSEYIFSPAGEPIESNYRTLKNVCEDLKIPYGRFTDGGFVAHDLRHNFATEILPGTDIETARELLGHSNISQTSTYVHTNENRLREAVRKRDRIDFDGELDALFDMTRSGKIGRRDFVTKIKEICRI